MMLSLFPEEMINNPVNPASMFVWFISAKQYFSVITRRIVENYKLNLFDISLDPFEVKIGFGDTPTIKVKDVDFYYAYASAANLNGFNNVAPAQLAHSIALFTSIYCQDMSDEYEDHYTLNFIYAIYLLTFVFQAQIKQFPHKEPKSSKEIEDNFTWLIALFFSFYHFLLGQSGKVFDTATIRKIKQQFLRDHIEVFFMLMYFYQYAGRSLETFWAKAEQFFWWLFYDELHWGDLQALAQDFLAHAETTIKTTNFNTTEKNLISLLFPADILVKYVLDAPNISATIRHLITNLFNQEETRLYMSSFLDSDKDFLLFLTKITDYTHFKNTYFEALKKYITHMFHNQEPFSITQSKDVDEWISMIWEWGAVDMSKIPERIKQESDTMERLMNFYVTYIWWSRIGRWDSRYIRCGHHEILHLLHSQIQQNNKSDGSNFYNWLLKNYGKNNFYYKYAFENIRAWKEKFHLPFRATFREVYSNICIIRLFESSFLAILLQDTLPKEIKLYIKNSKIIKEFGRLFQQKISQRTQKSHFLLVGAVYGSYNYFFHAVRFDQSLKKFFLKDVDSQIKENFYTLDFWLHQEMLKKLKPFAQEFKDMYPDGSIAGIFAFLRETLLWFLMYCTYLNSFLPNEEEKEQINALKIFYIVDVLMLSDEFTPMFLTIIEDMLITYGDILKMLYEIDDNKAYFKIAKENWNVYSYKKPPEEIFDKFSGEDIIWFRWFLKTITYYSKRFIQP